MRFNRRQSPGFQVQRRSGIDAEPRWRPARFFDEQPDAQLGYLLNGAGFFHQAHRAVDDCHALLEVLALDLPTSGSPALALLLKTARKKTWRVWAEQSPFELKDSLKRRGYRWSDGSDGLPRSWYIDVHEAALNDEIAFLRAETAFRKEGRRPAEAGRHSQRV
jgi:DNA polymerase III subunit epsilon